MPSPGGFFDVAPAANVTRNSFRASATYRPQDAPFPAPPEDWYFEVDIAPASTGPWSPAPLFDSATDPCLGAAPDNRVSLGQWQFAGEQAAPAFIGDLVPTITPATEYHVRWTLFDDNDVQVDRYIDPTPVTTDDFPDLAACLPSGITSDAARASVGSFTGSWNFFGAGAACINDTIVVDWGELGAGFPNQVAQEADSGTPGVELTGLEPNLTYEFRVSGTSVFGDAFGPGPICTFTTEHLDAACAAVPQNQRPTSAELVASAGGNTLEPGWETRLVWGFQSGVWPIVVGPTGVPGGELAALGDRLPGQTLFFRSEIIDVNDSSRLIGWSDECQVTLPALAPPFANPAECVTADITKYEARAVGISAGLPDTLALRITGPNGQTIDGAPGDESPELALTGLSPDTDYGFTVQAFRVSDGEPVPATAGGFSTCSFRTLANVPPTITDVDDAVVEVAHEACDDVIVADSDGTVTSVTTSTAGATLTDQGAGTWRVCFTPTTLGSHDVEIVATDNDGDTTSSTWQVISTPKPVPLPDGDDCEVEAPCAPWCPVPAAGTPAPPEWCCSDIVDLEDPVHRARAEWSAKVASSILFRLSGFRFNGCCEAEEFLCLEPEPCGCPTLVAGRGGTYPPSIPVRNSSGGSWRNVQCCDGKKCGGCDCGEVARIKLPYGPVTEVLDITLSGVGIPVSEVVVRDDFIYFAGHTMASLVECFDPFPDPADITDPVRGLYVKWTHGRKPPPDGVNAACKLACELTKACLGKSCQLPQRVTSVARQGVSWTVMDPMEFISEGRTGIYEVDIFLAGYMGIATTVTFPEAVAPINFGERARPRW